MGSRHVTQSPETVRRRKPRGEAKSLCGPGQPCTTWGFTRPMWKPTLEMASLRGTRDGAPAVSSPGPSPTPLSSPGAQRSTLGADSWEGGLWSAQEGWARPCPLHRLNGMCRAWHETQPHSQGPPCQGLAAILHLAWGKGWWVEMPMLHLWAGVGVMTPAPGAGMLQTETRATSGGAEAPGSTREGPKRAESRNKGAPPGLTSAGTQS